MASSRENQNGYILNRDWRAMSRLNHRHLLFKMTQGYLKHPNVDIGPGARVADIGTGTCIWPIDLLSELPFNVHIDAIDVSPAQFPRPKWLPEGINVIVHDVFQPFPEHMLGKYDLVHVQNFLCIWRSDKSEILLQNLVSLLKPTGYIQWTEQDVLLLRVLRAVGASVQTHSAAERMIEWFLKPREDIEFWVRRVSPVVCRKEALMRQSWIPNLDNILKNQRLESVAFDRQPVVNSHQMFHNVIFLETYVEFISNLNRVAETPEEKERAAKLRDIEEQASEELLNGVGLYCELVTAVARRSGTG